MPNKYLMKCLWINTDERANVIPGILLKGVDAPPATTDSTLREEERLGIVHYDDARNQKKSYQ